MSERDSSKGGPRRAHAATHSQAASGGNPSPVSSSGPRVRVPDPVPAPASGSWSPAPADGPGGPGLPRRPRRPRQVLPSAARRSASSAPRRSMRSPTWRCAPLQGFVAERGKIVPRRLTGVCTTHQRPSDSRHQAGPEHRPAAVCLRGTNLPAAVPPAVHPLASEWS